MPGLGSQAPQLKCPRIAFAGQSEVGLSKEKEPGKSQAITSFLDTHPHSWTLGSGPLPCWDHRTDGHGNFGNKILMVVSTFLIGRPL